MPKVGGGNRDLRYAALFVMGVAIGTVVRLGVFVAPTRLVEFLKERRLPDQTEDP